VLLVLVSLAAVLIVRQSRRGDALPGGREAGSGEATSQFNFSLALPGEPWRNEVDLKRKDRLDCNVRAMSRTAPDAWFAVAAREYKDGDLDRSPRQGELQHEALTRLRTFFSALELEGPTETTWAGQPAFFYKFAGIADDVLMHGHVHVMHYKGIGYWFFTWAPADAAAQAQPELDRLREGFKLGDMREGWREATPNVKTYRAEDGSWQVVDAEAIWRTRDFPANDYHEKAVLALEARPKNLPRDATRRPPTLLVLVLPKADDPLAAAVAEFKERMKRDDEQEGTQTTVEEVPEKPPAGGGGAPVVRLRSRKALDKDSGRFHVLSAVDKGDQLVVVQVECAERLEPEMGPSMMRIAASLK
jgi:hypothetical protein